MNSDHGLIGIIVAVALILIIVIDISICGDEGVRVELFSYLE